MLVQWLLRHNFWMVKLGGVAIVMALVANIVTTLLALHLLSSAGPPRVPDDEASSEDTEDEEPILASAATQPGERARQAERRAERILGRNLFCPTCSPAQPSTPEDEALPLEPEAALAGAKRSALPLVVAATMESDDPALSVATLVDVERGIGGLFGVGDKLGGDVEILGVTTGMVHIRNAGQLEYIPFNGAPTPPKSKPDTKKKPTTPRTPTKRSIPGAREAIQCNEAGDCVVDRAFVEQLVATPKLLVGQGRASPTTTKDGAPGFKLRSVRKGTLPDLLGLRNGDVITDVGGAALTLDALPGLFGKLRHASHIEMRVDRRGQKLARQLEIRS